MIIICRRVTTGRNRTRLTACSNQYLNIQRETYMILESDLVLVHVDNKPGFYARLEEITPDVKPGWWQVKLLVLTFPLQVFTWILDEEQLDEAPFTMGGTPLRLEKLISPLEEERRKLEAQVKAAKSSPPADAGQKVVSLADRRKK
jgi:hypothetical protein